MPVEPFSLPLAVLYAETHFRFFRFFPSLLYRRSPEVLFDLPKRLDPGQDLPVFLFINDAGRFPFEPSDAAIAVSQKGSPPLRFDFPDISPAEIAHPLRPCLRAYRFIIPRPDLPSGLLSVNARVTLRRGRRTLTVFNDTYGSVSRPPFSCFAADEPLPGSPFCAYGDLHTHSLYSQSHVEFGPPLEAVRCAASASGLSFVAVTDHSYDLSCALNDYLKDDPELGRWKMFREEMARLAADASGVLLIPGEEVSCLNGRGEVVHLCGIGITEYIPGALDGGRAHCARGRCLSLGQAAGAIHGQNGAAFAAHPGVRPGFLQRLFLKRGSWSLQDLQAGIDGMQNPEQRFFPLVAPRQVVVD